MKKMSKSSKSGGSGSKSTAVSANNNGGAGGEHIFKKYLNDLRNLTVGRKSSLKLELSTSQADEDHHHNRHHRHRNSDDDDDEDEQEFASLDEEDEDISYSSHNGKKANSKLNKVYEKLRNQTKSQIPWQNLDPKSAQMLISTFLDHTPAESLPALYSRKGNKISSNQVKKWHKVLEKVASETTATEKEQQNASSAKISAKSSIRMASKKFLITKKRQLLDKMSRRTSKTINDISHSCGELSRSVSKLYANVPTPAGAITANGHSAAAGKDINDESCLSSSKKDKDLAVVKNYS